MLSPRPDVCSPEALRLTSRNHPEQDAEGDGLRGGCIDSQLPLQGGCSNAPTNQLDSATAFVHCVCSNDMRILLLRHLSK